jgi:hypothetical protein
MDNMLIQLDILGGCFAGGKKNHQRWPSHITMPSDVTGQKKFPENWSPGTHRFSCPPHAAQTVEKEARLSAD